jgi:single-strand DNA-binding protein
VTAAWTLSGGSAAGRGQETTVNEPHVTVVGYVAGPPRCRQTPTGISVSDFRVAATPRRRNREGEWSDAETIWFGITAWRALGEHVAQSLKKGDRVVVSGTLGTRTYETEAGERRSNLEIQADSIGLELSRGTAAYVRAPSLVTNSDPYVDSGDVDPVTGVIRAGGPLDQQEPADDAADPLGEPGLSGEPDSLGTAVEAAAGGTPSTGRRARAAA